MKRTPDYHPDSLHPAPSRQGGAGLASRRSIALSLAAGGLVVALTFLIMLAGAGHAAFPGRPGAIGFSMSSTLPVQGGISETGGIFMAVPGQANPTQITTNPRDSQPSFSPSGQQIAFIRATTSPAASEVHVVNVDGTGDRTLTTGFSDSSPRFSPDGQFIVFSRRTTSEDLFVIRTDGTELRPLTLGPPDDIEPSFSPNGNKLIFTSNRDRDQRTDHSDIFVMNANGSGVRAIVNGPRSEGEPTFSPSGRMIAFSSDGNLFVARANGRGVRRLTRRGSRRPCRGTCYSQPAFSPNGRAMAALVTGRRSSAIITFRLGSRHRTSRQRDLAGGSVDDEGFGVSVSSPDWQRLPG